MDVYLSRDGLLQTVHMHSTVKQERLELVPQATTGPLKSTLKLQGQDGSMLNNDTTSCGRWVATRGEHERRVNYSDYEADGLYFASFTGGTPGK